VSRPTLWQRLGRGIIRAAWPNISLDEFAQQMDAAIGGGATRAGVAVGPQSAMAISAFFCGVNLIMGAIASMPCMVYRRTGDASRERFRAHPLTRVLSSRANGYMTAHQWKRAMVGRAVLWGNAYSIMLRDLYRGTVIEVEKILEPGSVKTFRDRVTGRLSYEITHGPGQVEVLSRDGAPRFVFHVPGPGFNGITGFSLLHQARESMGLTLAMEEYGQRFFGQGIHAGGFIERPATAPKLEKKSDKERMLASFEEGFAGITKVGKLVLLEEGQTFKPNIIPLEDAQFLTSRTHQIDEVARWLNLSPARLKELSRATFSNIEQLQIMDLQDCFLPWCSLFESEINLQLIGEAEMDDVFAEFKMDALLRADSVARNNALAVQRQWGIINADEWRSLENMNPQPDGQGKKYIVPSNYTVADKIGLNPAPADPKAPVAPQPEPPEESKPAAQNQRVDIHVGSALRRKRIEDVTRDKFGNLVSARIVEEEMADGQES
jgi:HK97 family phage portal protein